MFKDIIKLIFVPLGLTIDSYFVFPLIILLVIILVCSLGFIIFHLQRKKKQKESIVQITSYNTSIINSSEIIKSENFTIASLNKDLEPFGFGYHRPQDVFYSLTDGWQRECGYCQLYDEGCPALSMIIDCEPIYFEYNGKKWLIELWKGQYGMTTGCEIGVYTTTGPIIDIPGVFNGTFYYCASDEDHLMISCILKKHGKQLFYRKELHWWLTGFVLGEFSHPSNLVMDVEITLLDSEMRDAFVGGLLRTGYASSDLTINGNTVSLIYDKPHSDQPATRTPIVEFFMQTINSRNCKAYMDATKDYNNTLDKLNFIKSQAPKMYKKILNVASTKELFKAYELIKRFLERTNLEMSNVPKKIIASEITDENSSLKVPDSIDKT